MRQYAWYSPELNVIVLQAIMEDCYISFEWSHWDLHEVKEAHGLDYENDEPMGLFGWIPLGEL